ncbi:hypothetical protein [Janibacter melonis]
MTALGYDAQLRLARVGTRSRPRARISRSS